MRSTASMIYCEYDTIAENKHCDKLVLNTSSMNGVRSNVPPLQCGEQTSPVPFDDELLPSDYDDDVQVSVIKLFWHVINPKPLSTLYLEMPAFMLHACRCNSCKAYCYHVQAYKFG